MNSNPRRLYRSADDRILAGVAGGVAAYFDVDPVIVRVIWFISIFLSGSLTFWAYLVMIIVVPLEPADWPAQSPWAPGGAPVTSGWVATPPPADPTAGGASTAGTASTAGAPTPAANAAPDTTGDPNVAGFAAPAQPVQTGDWRSQRRQERWERRAERWEHRAEREARGPGLIFGLLLILIGGLLAAHQIDPNFDLNITWPIVIIAVGGLLVASSIRINRD